MGDDSRSSRPFWKSRAAIAWLVFGAISMFLLLSEHRAHVPGVLPYLLLFSCPLMHLFMHHGHHHHGEGKGDTHADSGEDHARHG